MGWGCSGRLDSPFAMCLCFCGTGTRVSPEDGPENGNLRDEGASVKSSVGVLGDQREDELNKRYNRPSCPQIPDCLLSKRPMLACIIILRLILQALKVLAGCLCHDRHSERLFISQSWTAIAT